MILHMAWQLSCHAMNKIVTWLDHYLSCNSNAYFHKISMKNSWKPLWHGSVFWPGSVSSKYAQCTPHILLVMVRYEVSPWDVSSKSDLWAILVLAVLYGFSCHDVTLDRVIVGLSYIRNSSSHRGWMSLEENQKVVCKGIWYQIWVI